MQYSAGVMSPLDWVCVESAKERGSLWGKNVCPRAVQNLMAYAMILTNFGNEENVMRTLADPPPRL